MKKIYLALALFLLASSAWSQGDQVTIVQNGDGMKLVVNGKGLVLGKFSSY
jgi:predicted peroxiredoxin